MNGLDIKKRRENLGLTQLELAKKLQITRKTINSYENGANIPASKSMLFEQFFENLESDFWQNSSEQVTSTYNTEEVPTGYYFPNVSASAGLTNSLINEELNKIPIYLPNFGKEVIFINVFGDSMYPKYNAGEIIGVKLIDFQYLSYGYAYVVVLKNEDVFIKYVRKGKDNNHVILASENPEYEPREFHIKLIKSFYSIRGVIKKEMM